MRHVVFATACLGLCALAGACGSSPRQVDDAALTPDFSAADLSFGDLDLSVADAAPWPELDLPALPVTNRHRVDVVLLREIQTCIIGDACSGDVCAGLYSWDNTQQLDKFAINVNLRAVPPGAPEIAQAERVACMTIGMEAARAAEIRTTFAAFATAVEAWTDGTITLDVHVHEVTTSTKTSLSTELGNQWTGFWADAIDVKEIVRPYVTEQTDFVFVVHGHRDSTTQKQFIPAAAGRATDPMFGVFGAGYCWVLEANADETVIAHEWMHLVYTDLHLLSEYATIYGAAYPACGEGDPDPTKWFPDMHDCFWDPDYKDCRESDAECIGNLDFVEHVLRVHWPRTQRLIANLCRTENVFLKVFLAFQECL